MARGFWDALKKPVFALAPMADVTDPAFRRVIAKYGKPDVMFTEFVSADGLFLADARGREKIERDLQYTEAERPIVAQFFTARPDLMERAARYAADHGFDGFDINMGCPDRGVEKQGAGAALIKNPALAAELIASAWRGATSGTRKIPVSVKTRLGYNRIQTEEWIPELLAAQPAALTIHARTRKEMSNVPPHWDEVARAVSIRDLLQSETLLLGNGGLLTLADAQKKIEETGADGMMLGKGIFGNPWLFSQRENNHGHSPISRGFSQNSISVRQCLEAMVEHARLFEQLLGGYKNFSVMKKNFKAYASGFDGAKELRVRLFAAANADEVAEIAKDFLMHNAAQAKQRVDFMVS